MDWPPQNAEGFQVPYCVRCCATVPTESIDTFAYKTNCQGYTFRGVPPFDSYDGFTFYKYVSSTYSWSADWFLDYDCTEYVTTTPVAGSSNCADDECAVAGNPCSQAFPEEPPGCIDNYTSDVTATSTTVTGTGESAYCAGYFVKATGTGTITLSGLWSEEEEIALQISCYGGYDAEWSPTFISSNVADYWPGIGSIHQAFPGALEMYGLSCAYHDALFQRKKSGFTPMADYHVSIDLYRMEYPAGTTWTLYATIEEDVTADAMGVITLEGSVPNARGYATTVAPASFTATEL